MMILFHTIFSALLSGAKYRSSAASKRSGTDDEVAIINEALSSLRAAVAADVWERGTVERRPKAFL